MSSDIDADTLASWKAACEAATPGPWYVVHGENTNENGYGACGLSIGPHDDDHADTFMYSDNYPAADGVPDVVVATFEFAALAREALPRLLDRVQELEAWQQEFLGDCVMVGPEAVAEKMQKQQARIAELEAEREADRPAWAAQHAERNKLSQRCTEKQKRIVELEARDREWWRLWQAVDKGYYGLQTGAGSFDFDNALAALANHARGCGYTDVPASVIQTTLERCEQLEAENARLLAQLPESMKHCTIVFKECEKGHGWLTATNWIQHGCPTCERDRLCAALEGKP